MSKQYPSCRVPSTMPVMSLMAWLTKSELLKVKLKRLKINSTVRVWRKKRWDLWPGRRPRNVTISETNSTILRTSFDAWLSYKTFANN
jgi:hypothetical protein